MKILIVSALSKPLQDSGYCPVEQHVRAVANNMSERGHEVWVVSLKGSSPEAFKIVQVEPDEDKAYATYKPMLDQFEAVIDFSNLKYTYLYKQENPKLKLLGPCYPYQALGYLTAPPTPFPCMIATSESMAQAMSAKLGCSFKVVNYFPSPPPEGFELPPRSDRLLFLGRFEKAKGAHIAVDVARQLRVGIDVAGEDVLVSDQRYMIQLLQKADGKLVRVYGRVNEDVKHELLAKAKAVILPYLEDGSAWTCQTILEAYMHGTPVITLRRGAVDDLVTNGITGWKCDKLEELPEAVKNIEQISNEACAEKAKLFNPETAVDNYQGLLSAQEW
jgi:glycosyltransferase involved in cell wall biosynthesis